MANQEQLARFKRGVKTWNKWRKEHPKVIRPNLRGAYLEGKDLRGADLRGANLGEAYLGKADLTEANLSGADLFDANLAEAHFDEANLIGANLTKAKLYNAWLSGANLSGANLTKAQLYNAWLRGANLSGANLTKANLLEAFLSEANLRKAKLTGADLSGANLFQADLSGADLRGANLVGAYFLGANLSGAELREANLSWADLTAADLREANLSGANLSAAHLIETDLFGANLTGAKLGMTVLVHTKVDKAKISGSLVYGISVWDLEGEFEEQKDLVITDADRLAAESERTPIITVDNIKVAQFIYLILNNEEIRDVINTLTSKSILILGRFAIPERKAILDALRNKLREYNLLPIVFDFDRPTDKDFTETIKTLAGLCYFVIADVTNPKSSPLELQATVPDYQIPFVPIIQEGERPFALMVDLQKTYNWVLDTLTYSSKEMLIKVLKPAIIDPAIQKHNELRLIKAREPKIRSAEDFIDKS